MVSLTKARVQAGTLDVQNLTAQGQDGLKFAVARPLRAACGIALDDEDFGLFRVAGLNSLPACPAALRFQAQLCGASRSRAFLAAGSCAGGRHGFVDDALGTAGFSSRNVSSLSLIRLLTRPRISVLPSLPFVWPSNCASCSFTLMTHARPSRTSSPERFLSASFRMLYFPASVIVDRTREGALEAVEVRTAVHRVNVVCKGQDSSLKL